MPASPPSLPLPPRPDTIPLTLLALLCCPVCPDRPTLRLTDNHLTCDHCGRVFPIYDGLPDLRPESGVLPPDQREENTQDTSLSN